MKNFGTALWKIFLTITISLIAIYLLVVLGMFLIFNVLLHSPTNYWTSIVTVAVSGICWISFLCWYFSYLKKCSEKTTNSGFMDKKEFDKLGNFKGKEMKKNSIYLPLTSNEGPKGWILDSKMKKGEIRYKHYNPGCHMLVYGMSRSGKTTGYVLPTIFANAYSKEKPCFIVTDPKGELYELTVDVLKQQGYRIYKLDIINANYSNKINPLTDIWEAYQTYQNSDIENEKYEAHQNLTDLVDELMMALVPDDATKKGDDIWTIKARDYWKMILYYNLDLSILPNPAQTKDNFTLLSLLNDFNNNGVEKWIALINKIEELTKGKNLVHLYKAVLSVGQDAKATFESIKANASMAVSFISNASVTKLTSGTDVDLKNFDEIPTALFIIIDNDRPNLKNITNIYLKKVIHAITSKQSRCNNKEARPIYLIGDEIGNIPPIYNLDGLLTTCLYKSIYCMLIFQDKQQLIDRYGRNGTTIANNCDLSVIVKVKNLEQAREWSGAFGTYTAKKTTTVKGDDNKISKTTTEFEKDIISAGELLKLFPKILIWLAGCRPIICNRTPIYETKFYKENVKNGNKKLFIPEKNSALQNQNLSGNQETLKENILKDI